MSHFTLPLVLDQRGTAAVIPPKANRKTRRHLAENYFAKIKEFRGIATRYDKTGCSYRAAWYLVATVIAAR